MDRRGAKRVIGVIGTGQGKVIGNDGLVKIRVVGMDWRQARWQKRSIRLVPAGTGWEKVVITRRLGEVNMVGGGRTSRWEQEGIGTIRIRVVSGVQGDKRRARHVGWEDEGRYGARERVLSVRAKEARGVGQGRDTSC